MSGDSHDIYTGSDTFGIVVNHYGDARGTKNQFANSDPSSIDPLINENAAAYHFATETLAVQLASIRSALEDCWTGNSADNALNILTQLSTDATTIGSNTKACHDSFVTFQSSWTQLTSRADNLYEGVAGTGVHEDNDGAHAVFKQFTGAMQTSMRAMPAHLQYQTPIDSQHAGPGPGPGGPGPGPGGPGPGPGGWGPGPGSWGPGPGTAPGHIGPGATGTPGPGFVPGPGPGPGHIAPGTSYPGGNAGFSPGSGLDTGSQLAGYTAGSMGPGGPGGPGFGGGPGPGFGVPGPGPGFGAPGPGAALTGAAGLGASGTLEAEAGISGVGSRTATGARPMMGRGIGGDDEDERDRTTWLSEEEGIWDGESDAPPGIIA